MLDVDSAIPFLVRHGLLRKAAITEEHVRAEAIPRRNRNLCVIREDGSGYFIKQPDDLGTGSRQTLRREGGIYLRHSSSGNKLAEIMPSLILFQPSVPLLILEYEANYSTLAAYTHEASGWESWIPLWREIGRSLGLAHQVLTSCDHGQDRTDLDPLDLLLGFIKPSVNLLTIASPALLQVLRIIQNSPALQRGLDSIGDIWNRDTVIHGDVRADNVLVPFSKECTSRNIRLIDWELSNSGDAMWDIAGILEFGVRIMFSDDIAGRNNPFPNLMTVMQTASRALLHEYQDVTGGTTIDASKVAVFTAARLVHSVAEMTTRLIDLPGSAALFLQISENIFADPGKAAHDLLAITTVGAGRDDA